MDYKVKVKYFVPIAGLMGKVETINLRKKATDLGEFFNQLKQNHTEFNVKKLKTNTVILVNGKLVKSKQILRNGDEIVLLSVQIGG